MSTAQKTKTSYADIKDVTLTDFLDVEAERSLVAHELWKEQATIVIGKFFFFCSFSLGVE
jgi:hypothetical protein